MKNNITMIELFSGIGAQERAIRQLGLPCDVINTCDCDSNAVLSYAAMRWDLGKEMETFEFPSQDKMIEELQAKNLGYDFQSGKHGITKRTPINKLKQYYIADKLSANLGDISKVNKLPYADIVTYSFPCTDLSVAGKGEGMVNKCDACGHSWPIDFSNAEEALICPNCGATVSSSTRSGLLGQVQRLLSVAKGSDTLPKYLLLENVKNLVGKKFKPQFDAWLKWLDSIGYNTYWKVLNAKNFSIPQNRERIFAISIRKDIDINGFTFPEPISLTIRLKDILENNVDEKYYLPDERIEKILNSSFNQERKRIQTTDVCGTLCARDWKDPLCVPVEEDINPVRIGNIYDEKFGTGYAGNVWDTDGISPTLQTAQGGNRMPLVVDEIKVVGNYMPSNHDASRVVDVDGIAPTVKENHGTVTAIVEPQIVQKFGDRGTSQYSIRDYAHTIPANPMSDRGQMVLEPKVVKVGQASTEGSQCGTVYSTDDLAPTLTAGCHGYAMGYIAEEQEPQTNIKERFFRQVAETVLENQCEPGDTIDAFNKKVNHSGVSPTITTTPEGFKTAILPVVEEPFIVASRGRNPENPSDRTTGAPTEQRLEPNFSGTTNCLTSVQKDNYVCEPQVLRAERTEYGKAIRKQYEAGEIDEKIGNIREMKPRTDGVSNTITTLLKDNYVVEPITCENEKVAIVEDQFPESRDARIYKDYSPSLRTNCGGLQVANGEDNLEPQLEFVGGIGDKDWAKDGKQLSRNYPQGSRVYSSDGIASALTAQGVGGAGGFSGLYAVDEEQPKIKWRIRKLTPLECWRLMNFTDQDCNRAAKYVSASALYKQAGNSIVVACLIAIFSSIFIKDGYKFDTWTKYSLNYCD